MEIPAWSIPWMAAPGVEVGAYVTSLPRVSTATHWLDVGHDTPVSATPVPLAGSICVTDGVTAVGSNAISLPCPSTAVHVVAAGQATALSACDPSIDTGGDVAAPGVKVISLPTRSTAAHAPPATHDTALRGVDPSMLLGVALVSGSLFGLNET